MLTEKQQQVVDEAIENAKIIWLAKKVVNNEHFRQLLMTAQPGMRKQVYQRIKPHLKFKAKPYILFKF